MLYADDLEGNIIEHPLWHLAPEAVRQFIGDKKGYSLSEAVAGQAYGLWYSAYMPEDPAANMYRKVLMPFKMIFFNEFGTVIKEAYSDTESPIDARWVVASKI